METSVYVFNFGVYFDSVDIHLFECGKLEATSRLFGRGWIYINMH
jgi:hypothetical protein